MQVTVETTEGLERRMRVVVPAEKLQHRVDAKIKHTARNLRLKGFRPGKVPLREVRRRFGKDIRYEVSAELIQSSCREALEQEAIRAAARPEIEDVSIEEGRDLEYTAVFDVLPEVEIKGLENIEVVRPVSRVEESDIDKVIDACREQQVTFHQVDRAYRDGDEVDYEYEGFVDGKALEDGKAEGSGAEFGFEGVDEALLGMSAGEEKEVEVTLPETWPDEKLVGRAAVFRLKVNRVSEPRKPELDEAFFKLLGVEEGGMAALREQVGADMERELQAAIKARLRAQVVAGLMRENELELPKRLVEDEADRIRQEMEDIQGGNMEVENGGEASGTLLKQAQERVKFRLLVRNFFEQNNIQPDERRVREMIESLASIYEEPEQVVDYYRKNPEKFSRIQDTVIQDQVVDHVLPLVKVSEVDMPFLQAVTGLDPAEGGSEDETAAED